MNKQTGTDRSSSYPISHNFYKAQMIKTGKMPKSLDYHKKSDHADKPKELIFLNMFNNYVKD